MKTGLVVCPDCGCSFKALGSHRNSTPCVVWTRRRRLHEQGFVVFVHSLAVLKEAGIEIRVEATKYDAGAPTRRSRVTNQLWAPDWAAELAEFRRREQLRNFSQQQTYKPSREEIVKELRALAQDEELRLHVLMELRLAHSKKDGV